MSATPKKTSKAPTPGTSTPATSGAPGTKPLAAALAAAANPGSVDANGAPLTSIDQLPDLPPSPPQNKDQPGENKKPGDDSNETNDKDKTNLPPPPASSSKQPSVKNTNSVRNSDNDDDDSDSDDDSNASSDGYDFSTGNIVVRTDMSPKRKQEILERAMKQREKDTMMHVENHIKPLPPRRTTQSIRQRSRVVLEEAREDVAYELGVPPRVVYDEETGYILPRESVVTIAKPIEVRDEKGNVSLVAAPTTGYGIGGKFDEIEREKTTEKTTAVHYQRSVEALRYSQQQRLLRQLNLD